MEVRAVGELRKYTVTQNGYETVMKLNETDAKRLGGTPVDGGDVSPTEPDQPVDGGVAGDAGPAEAEAKGRRPLNKARAASNKTTE